MSDPSRQETAHAPCQHNEARRCCHRQKPRRSASLRRINLSQDTSTQGQCPFVSTPRREAESQHHTSATPARHSTADLTNHTGPGRARNPLTKPSLYDRRPPARPTRLGAFGPSPDRPHRRPSGSGPQEDPHQTIGSPHVLNEDVASPDTHQKRQASSPWRRSVETTGPTARLELPREPSPSRAARSERRRRRVASPDTRQKRQAPSSWRRNAETTGPTPGSSPRGALANVHTAQGQGMVLRGAHSWRGSRHRCFHRHKPVTLQEKSPSRKHRT